jgi:transcriptional regulator GlxA family with amidase domain
MLKQAKTRDRLVEESLRFIHQHIGSITIKYLLEHLHLSERQFERRFTQTVGDLVPIVSSGEAV